MSVAGINRTHRLHCGQVPAPVDSGSLPTWMTQAFEVLSTFPQPRSSTDTQELTSLFAECIHRPMHSTLALHPPGLA
jgi:hypothetical protein